MTRPNDYYPNDHWVISDMDGGKRLRSECKFGVDTERGLLMGEDEWSPVQPQTNIKSPTENLSVKDARPRPPVEYAPGQGPGEKRAVPWVNPLPPVPATAMFTPLEADGYASVAFPGEYPLTNLSQVSFVADITVIEGLTEHEDPIFVTEVIALKSEDVVLSITSDHVQVFYGGGTGVFHIHEHGGIRTKVGFFVNTNKNKIVTYVFVDGTWRSLDLTGGSILPIPPRDDYVTRIGSNEDSEQSFHGSIFRVRAMPGDYWVDNSLIDNPLIDFNPADATVGDTSWKAPTGETYTLQESAVLI